LKETPKSVRPRRPGLDMVMGYHQIEVEQEREETAFSTKKKGHWEYKRDWLD
jgi:hypothetical protein